MTTQFKKPEVILMTDIETMGLGPNSVITSIALVGVLAADPETILGSIELFLPMQPQLTILKRDIDAGTLLEFWLKQDDATREQLSKSVGDDFEEIASLLRHYNRKVVEWTEGREYEFIAKGQDFDPVLIRHLMEQVNLKPAWHYRSQRDLRTILAYSGISDKDYTRDESIYPKHSAASDCHWQLFLWQEAVKHARARS